MISSQFTMSKPSSVLQQMLSFLSGFGTSADAPQVVLFLVKELGTPLPIGGLTGYDRERKKCDS